MARKMLTEAELLALPKVGPEAAAAFLQNGTTAQEIRVKAQNGHCIFCTAERGTGRYFYRINVGMLIRFKNGELGLRMDGLPPVSTPQNPFLRVAR